MVTRRAVAPRARRIHISMSKLTGLERLLQEAAQWGQGEFQQRSRVKMIQSHYLRLALIFSVSQNLKLPVDREDISMVQVLSNVLRHYIP